MNTPVNQFPDGMLRAYTALYGPHVPMTAAELEQYAALKAREMARAEARRAGVTPQAVLPLDGVC